MKKLFLSVLLAAFTLSIYSCRENTQDSTETTIEEAETDVNDALEQDAELDEGETGTEMQNGNQETNGL